MRPTRSNRPAPPPSGRSTTSGPSRLRAAGPACRRATLPRRRRRRCGRSRLARSAGLNPDRTYNVYFYDSVTGGGGHYDHAIVSPVGKTGAAPSIDLKVGDFLPIKLIGANGLIGARAGQTVGHYVKLISLAGDASQFKLYDTSLARAIATCGTACDALPAGGAGEDRLEKYIADNLLPWAAADFAPEEAGVVDEDTYVQQGRDLERAYSLQVINYILGTLQRDTDLAMVGYPFTDEVSHQFMGLVSPTEPGGAPNPCYDVDPKFADNACTGRGTAAPGRDPRGVHPQRLRGRRREARRSPAS